MTSFLTQGTLSAWFWCQGRNKEYKKSADFTALFIFYEIDVVIARRIFAVLGNKSGVSRRYSGCRLTQSIRACLVFGNKSDQIIEFCLFPQLDRTCASHWQNTFTFGGQNSWALTVAILWKCRLPFVECDETYDSSFVTKQGRLSHFSWDRIGCEFRVGGVVQNPENGHWFSLED